MNTEVVHIQVCVFCTMENILKFLLDIETDEESGTVSGYSEEKNVSEILHILSVQGYNFSVRDSWTSGTTGGI